MSIIICSFDSNSVVIHFFARCTYPLRHLYYVYCLSVYFVIFRKLDFGFIDYLYIMANMGINGLLYMNVYCVLFLFYMLLDIKL